MSIWLILAFLFAALEAAAVYKSLRRLEMIAKPAVMVFLFLWLYVSTGLQGDPFWFGVGILFSFVGDVVLMPAREDLFLFGLIAFLFAHISYITGFQPDLAAINTWSFVVLMLIAVNASRLVWRMIGAMRINHQKRLIVPVVIYGAVISFMLYAALSTFYDPLWKTNSALLVSSGAFLFWISDLTLAWNKFVSPIKNGRVFNMALYHLGQISLVAGVISQFS